MDLFGSSTPKRPKKPRPPSLTEKTGVAWPWRHQRDRPGTDPRLVELRLSLDRAVGGNDADNLAWVLCVALGWLSFADLLTVAERVGDLLEERTGDHKRQEPAPRQR